MYIILKIKLNIKTVTKDIAKLTIIMLVGFILIIAMLLMKFKPVYEVKIENEKLGYISKISDFKSRIEEEIVNQTGENIDSISLTEEPEYELKLITRNTETNEDEVISKLAEQNTITTYKFYAVVLNEKSKTFVDTIEEAEEVVNQIKSEYDGNGLDLDLTVTEIFTENKEDIKTDNVQVAEKSVEDGVEKLIEEKEAREAIASINGINLSVLPVSGTITSRFSDISSIRSYKPHTGLDIACGSGTDIKVVAKGTVVYAGWDAYGLGNVVKVDHGNGVETWYGHCNKIYVSTGDVVSAGDVISAVGSTGNSTGPHLHFEIRINGNAVNPQIYVYNK